MIARILLLACNTSIERLVRFALKYSRSIIMSAGTDNLFTQLERHGPHIIILHEDCMAATLEECVRKIRSQKKYNYIRMIVIAQQAEPLTFSDVLYNETDEILYVPVTSLTITTAVNRLLQKDSGNDKKVLVFNNLTIQPERYTIEINGSECLLPKKEFLLLYLLASEPGKIFSRNEIMENVWEKGVMVGDRTIDVHVRKIRQKINADYIHTIKSVGYKFSIEEDEAIA